MRTVSENLDLDMSLRRSRSTWAMLGVGLLPAALFGIATVAFGLTEIFQRGIPDSNFFAVLWEFVFGLILIAIDVFCFRMVIEASARIRRLRVNPNSDVESLHTPFTALMHGWYQ